MNTKIWLILIFFTLLTFISGYLELLSSFVVILLLVSILIKGQLISDYFMGLKNTQNKYRFITTIWLVVVISLIAISYFYPISD